MVDILAFGAHPDDLEFGMGGTLLKLGRKGLEIAMVHLTRGEKGTFGSPEEREEEAKATARMIGASVEFLDFVDGGIHYSVEGRLKVARIIRKYRPKVIFAPHFANEATHPDHSIAGRLVKDGVKIAGLKNVDLEFEHHKPRNVFYYILPHTLQPTFFVDVSDLERDMLDLFRCYKSQAPLFKEGVESLLRFRTRWAWRTGSRYLEAFYADGPIDATNVDICKF